MYNGSQNDRLSHSGQSLASHTHTSIREVNILLIIGIFCAARKTSIVSVTPLSASTSRKVLLPHRRASHHSEEGPSHYVTAYHTLLGEDSSKSATGIPYIISYTTLPVCGDSHAWYVWCSEEYEYHPAAVNTFVLLLLITSRRIFTALTDAFRSI